MKRNDTYEVPQLGIAEIGVEQGFAISPNSIENPFEMDEETDVWS